MSGVRRMLSGALGHGMAIAIGLSAVFLVLLALTSPVAAAAVTVPASIAVGVARARHLPLATPHSLTAPAYGDRAVVANAPRAAELIASRRASSAA
jgi:hypothetical protein